MPNAQPAPTPPVSLLARVRSGDWLTAERVLVYGRIFLGATVAIVIGWLALSHGNVDMTGKPLGPDFLNVYAAGVLVQQGHPADAYDWEKHRAAEQAVVPYDEYFGWHYPPMFLALAALLASLPYLPALGLYMAATLAGYAAVLRALVGRLRHGVLLALAFPGVFANLGHGQNGFLTTGLFGAALMTLERRPVVSGVLFGLMAYKPQFGLLIPVALLAARAWTAIAAAAVTVLLTASASALAFGLDTWLAFRQSLSLTQSVVLEEGATGWPKIVSLFSAAMGLGAPLPLAYAVQFAGLALAAVVTAFVWWRTEDGYLRAAALGFAIPLSTPYVLDYDLVLLAVPIACLALNGIERGFAPWQKSLLAALFVLPLIARSIAMLTHVSLTPLLLAAVLATLVGAVRRGDVRA
ncbi:glycosyltransferase family 87 protein [Oryzibacter oryziterrae]|uniref:glycosyltransferase family 87 protein n=1 Tax=Oryzibacter oryziterrae TaxID=2766474 RepID=UPI001F229B5E|nr:glycosyltransferase family 87 protein [Oryzibacter oryziterrae]